MKKKLVVLTGAGVSAESGVSTFRDSDGLWEQHKVEDVASILPLVKENVEFLGRSVQTPQGHRINALPDQRQHAGAMGIEAKFAAGSKNLPD